jgi:hypothetical protein
VHHRRCQHGDSSAATGAHRWLRDFAGLQCISKEACNRPYFTMLHHATPCYTHTRAQGCVVANAHGHVVPNRLFSGLEHPDKLESYVHRSSALPLSEPILAAGAGLAGDLRGAWALQHDSLRGLAVLRSLLYPGYAFYYDGRSLTWGGLYVGDGLRSDHLPFML